MDETNLYLSTRTIANKLAMLYLEKSDTADLTPAQFTAEYTKIFNEIYMILRNK